MYNFYFDIAAIIIFLLIIFIAFYKKMYMLKTTKILLLISILSIICCSLEILYACSNNDFSSVLYFTFFLIIRSLVLFSFLIYILYSLRAGIFLKKNKWIYSFLVPIIASLICLLINLFSHNLFDIRNHQMVLGNYAWIIYVVAGYFIILPLITLILSWKNVKVKQNRILLFIVFFISISILVQTLFKEIYFGMFGISIATLLILLTVERKEDLVANGINCLHEKLFKSDMNVYYNYESPFNVLLLKIYKYKAQESIMNPTQLEELLNNFVNKLDTSLDLYQLDHHSYYLNNGIFAIVFNKKPEDIKKVLLSTFDSKWVSDIGLQDLHILSIDAYNDIKSYDQFIDLCFRFEDYVEYSDGNNIIIYSEYALNNKTLLNLSYRELIETAIVEDKFEMFYQPIYNCQSKNYKQAEALLRLKTSDGYMFPSKLIEVAENNHYIEKITNIVFEKVCQFVISPEFKTLNLNYIEINVSSYEIVRKSFSDRVIEISSRYHIDPKTICFEIKESASIIDEEIFFKNMSRLIAFGFSFCLDAYGKSYTNITSLIRYPIKIIKFDRKFIADTTSNNMKSVVVSHMNMLKEIDKDVLIEGIETQESLDYFINLGANYLQGYYLSKPLPKDEFIKFINEQKKEN